MRNKFKGRKIYSLAAVDNSSLPPTSRGLFAGSMVLSTLLDPADKPRDVGVEAAAPHEIFIFENFRKRWMTFGNDYIQSAIYKRRPWKPLLYYIEPMTVCLHCLSHLKRSLILGMGGGSLIHYLQHYYPSLNLTAVEINATIIELAQQYFAINASASLRIINAAAEDFMVDQSSHFEVIFIDLYQTQNYPAACATADFFIKCKKLLSESGVLSINALYDNAHDFNQLLHLINTHISTQTLCLVVPHTSNIVIHAYTGNNFLDLIQQLAQRHLIAKLQWNADFGLLAE